MRYLVLFMLMCSPLYAHDITTPPVLKSDDKALIDYLKQISDNFNTPAGTTTAPNGNIIGEKNHLIVYSGQLWMNTDGKKTWVKVGP